MSPPLERREWHLDLVRGLSAVAVMAGHLRAFVFKDLGELVSPGWMTKIFYLATGLGHQAVMVFFVLSGYFVGGSVCRLIGESRFSWRGYGMARLSRLWVVLVPALLLTFACDAVGLSVAPQAYHGEWRSIFCSGPDRSGVSLTGVTFLGNLAFLQTVAVPVYGTNSPLWSLANEFWYYLIFPLAALACHRRFRGNGLIALVACLLLLWLLPWGLVSRMSVWLLGVIVWRATPWFSRRSACFRQRWFVLSGIAFLGGVVGCKWVPWVASDWVVGGLFAVWMLALAGPRQDGAPLLRPLRSMARVLSDISYTLYVVHFPLLFLVAAVCWQSRQQKPDLVGFGLFGLLLTAVVLFSLGWWWLFERQTDAVRKWLTRLTPSTPHPPLKP